MALVQLGGVLGDIRGKVGGSVFQRNNAGLIIRNSPAPINRNTVLQNSKRAITARLQWEWQGLTAQQRKDWEQWTKFYPIAQKNISGRFINGQQSFILTNFYRIIFNKNVLNSPVFSPFTDAQIEGTVTVIGPFLNFVTTAGAIDTYGYIILFITIPVPASLNNAGNRFRMLTFTTGAGGTHNITNAYTDVFGKLPVSGQTLFVKYTVASNDSGILHPFIFDKQTLT